MSRKLIDAMVDTNIVVYAVRGVVPSDKKRIREMCRAAEVLVRKLRTLWMSSIAWSEVLAAMPQANYEAVKKLGKKVQVECLDRGAIELAIELKAKYHPRAKRCTHCGQSGKPVQCVKCGLVGNETLSMNDAYIVATAQQVGAPILYTFDSGPRNFQKGVTCRIEEPEHADGGLFKWADDKAEAEVARGGVTPQPAAEPPPTSGTEMQKRG